MAKSQTISTGCSTGNFVFSYALLQGHGQENTGVGRPTLGVSIEFGSVFLLFASLRNSSAFIWGLNQLPSIIRL